ncbi:hypothetical protein WAI453_008860 [Rhynchosporium graminicola]
MIAGTSIGGFIAIMLGRLKMTVEKCLEKYIEFMKIVFPDKYTLTEWIKVGWSGQKWNLEPLENCIKKLISETLGTNKPEDIMLLDDSVTDNNCKVYIDHNKSNQSSN